MGEAHGYGVTSDCVCGRNFATVRGLREHLTKSRAIEGRITTVASVDFDHRLIGLVTEDGRRYSLMLTIDPDDREPQVGDQIEIPHG